MELADPVALFDGVISEVYTPIMIRLGNLIRRVFPHRAWPYPRGEREIREVIVATLFIVFALLICMIAGLKYEDEKILRSRDVYFAAKSITSYTSEAHLIAANLQEQSLVGPYREVYIKQLARNVSDSKDRLATHRAADEIQSQVVTLQLEDPNASNGGWFKLVADKAAKTVPLEDNQVGVVYFRLKAKRSGQQKLRVTARGTRLSDAVESVVDVLPDGRAVWQASHDRLKGNIAKTISIPSHVVAGGNLLSVSLHPGGFSQVVEGLEKILRG